MSLTPYQLAFSTCFVFWRENCRLTVLDQHNLHKPTSSYSITSSARAVATASREAEALAVLKVDREIILGRPLTGKSTGSRPQEAVDIACAGLGFEPARATCVGAVPPHKLHQTQENPWNDCEGKCPRFRVGPLRSSCWQHRSFRWSDRRWRRQTIPAARRSNWWWVIPPAAPTTSSAASLPIGCRRCGARRYSSRILPGLPPTSGRIGLPRVRGTVRKFSWPRRRSRSTSTFTQSSHSIPKRI